MSGVQEEFSDSLGALKLLRIIEANNPYPEAKFWIEKSDFGLYVIRSNLLRGLPRDEKQSLPNTRRNIQPKTNGGAGLRHSGKIHDGGT